MKFVLPGLASALAGSLLGVIAVFGITTGIQQNSIPATDTAPDSSQTETAYGSR